jgi:hypothetical protein
MGQIVIGQAELLAPKQDRGAGRRTAGQVLPDPTAAGFEASQRILKGAVADRSGPEVNSRALSKTRPAFTAERASSTATR